MSTSHLISSCNFLKTNWLSNWMFRCDDVYQPGVELFMRTVGGSCKNITQVILTMRMMVMMVILIILNIIRIILTVVGSCKNITQVILWIFMRTGVHHNHDFEDVWGRVFIIIVMLRVFMRTGIPHQHNFEDVYEERTSIHHNQNFEDVYEDE